jgi:hypothetical protein
MTPKRRTGTQPLLHVPFLFFIALGAWFLCVLDMEMGIGIREVRYVFVDLLDRYRRFFNIFCLFNEKGTIFGIE